jgi:FkbM family methyltransferase
MDKIINFNVFGVDYTVNDNKNQWSGGLGMSRGDWEIETFKVFEYVKNPEKLAIDIGSWIGPTSIWLSKNFKEILSVEPDVIALKQLTENLKLSNCENVWVLSNPIFSEDTSVFFGPNTNENWLNNLGLGESVSQTRLTSKSDNDYKTLAITMATLSKTINNFFPFSNVSFVKVDIEGGEEFILEELIKNAEIYHWSLWVSFHLDWWEDKNIERFRDLFNNAIEIKFNSIDFIDTDFDIIELIKNNPYASVYLKF